jgi:hypothetical protein
MSSYVLAYSRMAFMSTPKYLDTLVKEFEVCFLAQSNLLVAIANDQ